MGQLLTQIWVHCFSFFYKYKCAQHFQDTSFFNKLCKHKYKQYLLLEAVLQNLDGKTVASDKTDAIYLLDMKLLVVLLVVVKVSSHCVLAALNSLNI